MGGGFGGAGGFTNDGEITDSPSTTKKTGVTWLYLHFNCSL